MADDRSLDQWLSYLEQLHTKEIDLGLDRVKSVAERLELLSFSAKVVTVAGTNGKGSFVCALTRLLRHQGARVGAYTSPHIEDFNERIAIDGIPVSDAHICEAFVVIEAARGSTSLSYFEFATLASLLIFKQFSLDVIVLEVGLGGRLDAVNIVDPDVAVITSIGLDHQDWLGDTRELIGAEKAGILRAKKPFICVDSEPPQSIIDIAHSLQCKSLYLNRDIVEFDVSDGHDSHSRFKLSSASDDVVLNLSAASLPKPSLLAAAQAFYVLGYSTNVETVEQTLISARLNGRFEYVNNSVTTFILDVAHNPQAAELLAARLAQIKWRGVCVLAVMKDKVVSELLKPFDDLVTDWICTEIPNLPRSLSAEKLALALDTGYSVETHPSPSDAFASAVGLSQDKYSLDVPILVLGSFFLVSEFKRNYWPTVKDK